MQTTIIGFKINKLFPNEDIIEKYFVLKNTG